MVDLTQELDSSLIPSDGENSQYYQSKAELLVNQGKFDEAVECVEEAIGLKRKLCGDASNEALEYCRQATRDVIEALKLRFGAEDLEEFVRLLQRLEKAVGQIQPGLIPVELCEIYIALACAYRKLSNLSVAKQLTLKALQLSSIYQDAPIDRASVYLSMCAIMSSLREHEKALKYGKKGAKHAQEDLMREILEKTADSGEKLTILAVAYHNVAVEEEHLNSYGKALEWFKKAVLLLEKYGTERHMGILGDMRKSLLEAENSINHKETSRPGSVHRVLQRVSAPSSPMRSVRNETLHKGFSPRMPSPLVLPQAESLHFPHPHPLDSSFLDHRTPDGHRLDSETIRKEAEKEISGGKRGLKQRGNGRMRAGASQRNSPKEEELEGRVEFALEHRGEGTVNAARNEVKRFHSTNRQYQRSKAYLSEPTSALHLTSDIAASAPTSRAATVLPPLQSPRKTAPSQQLPLKPHSSLLTQSELEKSGPESTLEGDKTELMAKPTPRSDSDQLQTDTETQSPADITKLAEIDPGKVDRNPSLPAATEVSVPESLGTQEAIPKKAGFRLRSESCGDQSPGKSLNPGRFSQEETTRSQVLFNKGSEVQSKEVSELKQSLRVQNCSTAATLRSPVAESSEYLGKSDSLDWSEKGLDFVLVSQTIQNISRFGLYAVLLYVNRTDLKISAFPQERGRKLPGDLIVSLSEPRLGKVSLGPRFCEDVTSLLVLRDESTLDLLPESTALDSHLVELAIHQEVINKAAIVIQRSYRRHLAIKNYQCLKLTHSRKPAVFKGFRMLTKEHYYLIAMYQSVSGLHIEAVELKEFNRLILELDSAQVRDYMSIFNPYELLLSSFRLRDGKLSLLPSPIQQQKSAIVIQKRIRGHLARKYVQRMANASTRKLLFQRQKTFNSEIFNIAIYSISHSIQIESSKLIQQLHLKYKTESIFLTIEEVRKMYGQDVPAEMIFEDIVFRNDKIEHRPRPRKDLNQEVLTPRAQLRHMNEAVRPSEARSIIRSSLKLDDRMWVVTMSLLGEVHTPPRPDDLLEFTAFSSSAETPLKVRSRVQELAQLVKLPTLHIYPIGAMAIKRLLKIVEGTLVLDFQAEVPDVDKLATILQAHVKGFMVRRKIPTQLPKSNLLSCQLLTLDNESWVFYAYRRPPTILIEAVKRHSKETISIHIPDSLFTKFPPALSHKRIIDNFIFPKLSLVGDGQNRHLQISETLHIEEGLYEKHKEKLKVISGSPGENRKKIKLKVNTDKAPLEEAIKRGFDRRRATAHVREGNASEPNSLQSLDGSFSAVLKQAPASAASMMETETPTHFRVVSIIQPTAILPLQEVTEASQESENPSLPSFVLKPDLTDTAHPHRVPIVDLIHPPSLSTSPKSSLSRENKDLLMRAGLELSGIYYIVSIFKEKTGVLIDLVDHTKNLSIAKLIEGEEPGSLTEEYCEDLLSRIQLKSGAKGELEIDLKIQELSSQVLYKRSHYISNRFFNVTVSKTSLGVRIEAFDPIHHSTLSLSLAKTQDLLQREITPLINKLQIRTLMGVETLIMSG